MTMKPWVLESLVNEDKISHLPEDLLVAILSLLPTKDVVAAGVLSKRWRSLWKIVPELEFHSHINKSKHEGFSKNVSKLLLSHKAPVLQSLDLYFNYDVCGAEEITMWIGIAYTRHLHDLSLCMYSQRECFTFPRSLYNCETLETLKLCGCILIDITSLVSLKSLRTLHLKGVNCKDDASVLNLFSGCPNLQNLTVHQCNDLKISSIAVPSLQRLTIVDYKYEEDKYVINAPSLKYLDIQSFKGLSVRLIEIPSDLEEAYTCNVSITIDETLLRSITSVKRLSLNSSPSEITLPTGGIFYQLVYLKISIKANEWWNLLMFMLDCSPKLQVLELIDDNCFLKEFVSCGKWNQLKNVCKWLHLETFVWNSYNEQLKKEKEIAKYILRNANNLKRATFSIEDLNSDERLELLEELESAARDSNSSCEIFFP